MKFYNKSLEGSGHKVTGLPCQDYSDYEVFEFNQKQVLIMAISDGHGSKTYVRSHTGSRLACEIAIKETKYFVLKNYNYLIDLGKKAVSYSPDFGISQDALLFDLFSSIHNHWYEEIKRNSEEIPFTDEEKIKLGNADIKHAYGCTLMVCVKAEDFIFAYHLGDGRLYSISCLNEWKQPVPWDSDCEDNITTSLCEDDPVARFRYYIDSSNIQPYAIFMCSDGIEDCYGGSHDGDFKSERLIVDYSEVIRCFLQDEDFEKACCDFLNYQSERLSHDDMSIAFVLDDKYNIQSKWLRLCELRRLVFNIRSRIDSFSSEIRECDHRIANISTNIKNYLHRINELQTSKKRKSNDVNSLEQKQEEVRACAESASRFNAKIGDFQTAIKDYCDEFDSSTVETGPTEGFRKKLIKYVLTSLDNALMNIRKEIREKRDSDSNYNLEIEKLNKEIAEICPKLEKEIGEKEGEEEKLRVLELKRNEIENKAELYKKENSNRITEYTNEAKKIKEEIKGCLPSQHEIEDDDIGFGNDKTLNICKMYHGAKENDDITITYSQHDICGIWNGGDPFQISKEKFDEIIAKIKSVDSSLYENQLASSGCIAIMLPYENSETRYIPLSENEADEIWKICLALVEENLAK